MDVQNNGPLEVLALKAEITTLLRERDQARQGWAVSMLVARDSMEQLMEAEKKRIHVLALLTFSVVLSIVQGLIWVMWVLVWMFGSG